MPAAHSPVMETEALSPQEFDLGLRLPADFNLQTLFPDDRLLRLHPHWFISDFTLAGAAFSANIRDYGTDEEFVLAGQVIYPDDPSEFLRIELFDHPCKSITFLNKDNVLKVEIVSEQDHTADVHDSILLWVRGIREYIRIYLKKTPATLFFRIFMNRMVLRMDPSQRKICLMIAKITVVEVFVILLIVVCYGIFTF